MRFSWVVRRSFTDHVITWNHLKSLDAAEEAGFDLPYPRRCGAYYASVACLVSGKLIRVISRFWMRIGWPMDSSKPIPLIHWATALLSPTKKRRCTRITRSFFWEHGFMSERTKLVETGPFSKLSINFMVPTSPKKSLFCCCNVLSNQYLMAQNT